MIVGARLVSFELPFVAPLVAGDGIHETRSGLLLGLVGSDGAVGWGEAAPLPGWSTESRPEVEAALEGLVRSIGSRPREAASLAPTATAWLARVPTACAALDQALLDLAAASRGISLADLLAGDDPAADSVAVNALIGGASPDEVATSAAAAAADGFETFKLKLGDRAPGDDLARVAALRAAVGPAAAIRLDAGGRWDVETAIAVLRKVDALDIEYVEDPVGDMDALTQVASVVPVPVAADALLTRSEDPFAVVAAAAAAVFVVKPAPLGGPGPAARLIRAIRESGARPCCDEFPRQRNRPRRRRPRGCGRRGGLCIGPRHLVPLRGERGRAAGSERRAHRGTGRARPGAGTRDRVPRMRFRP